ncbi:MAG TPA: chromosome segregation ATPase [Nostocaceae cyanobacterium]|nr:chromosome segregation ATPase [Nostocaceae cyanobacterium]
MTERDIPDNLSPASARDPNYQQEFSATPLGGENQQFGFPGTGSTSKSVKRKRRKKPDSKATLKLSDIAAKVPSWMKSWVLWSLLLIVFSGGVGFISISMLLKLPSAPNCPSIFWPLASASVRLHCAQLAASKQTVEDLLQAISLVKELPSDHPLRGRVNQYLEQWSEDILRLADQSFHAGNLEEAIATARQIPQDLTVSQLVEARIAKWRSIWDKAEKIYQEAEQELKQRNWQSAFMLTAKLLRVDNKYWATTKYDQLNRIIVTAREDGDKLYKAESLADSGVADKVVEAIKLAESIKPESYLYQKAQELIPKFGRKMLDIAKARIKRRDADSALEIARQIPTIPQLQAEVDDFIVLAEAQRSAWVGTVSGLEAAIAQAQQIDASRDTYDEAQKLIARWQLEIEDVSRLERARTLASQGTVNDLTAAIYEAQLIPESNPRASEAREAARKWRFQVESIEDQPYLDQAEQMALAEDINSLQAAIAQANRIRVGRALYPEARRKIRQWSERIQSIQDQPYLDQARSLADNGDLRAAINTARPIANSGRALATEAQTAIDTWQEQINARENWRRAREVAATGTPEALVEAIRIADRVSNRNVLRMDVNVAINQWSEQILQIARTQSESDVNSAISTAELVPRSSSVYTDAQEQIRTWRQFINPPQPTPQETSTPISSNGL